MWFSTEDKKKRSARVAPKPVVATPISVGVQRAQSNLAMLQPTDVLQLQRTIGNQAVSGLLQRSQASGSQASRTTPPVVQPPVSITPAAPQISRTLDNTIQRVGENDKAKKAGLFSRFKRVFGASKSNRQPSPVVTPPPVAAAPAAWGRTAPSTQAPNPGPGRTVKLGQNNVITATLPAQPAPVAAPAAWGRTTHTSQVPNPGGGRTVKMGQNNVMPVPPQPQPIPVPPPMPVLAPKPQAAVPAAAPSSQASSGTTPSFANAAKKVAMEQRAAAAFAKSTFLYGTTGGGSMVGKFGEKLAEKRLHPKWAKEGQSHPWAFDKNGYHGQARHFNLYDPGPRVLAGDEHQMMDYFYGKNNDIHTRRDPDIGEYIHDRMNYQGDYDQTKPGWKTWKENYGKKYSADQQLKGNIEGWQAMQKPDPNNPGKTLNADIFHHPVTGKPLTGTKEISRIVREGIFTHGGNLVFEGKNVSWGDVFGNGYMADTTEEAVGLMPYFAADPGKATVKYGAGTLTFHWGGVPTVPTRGHFHENWFFKEKDGKPVFHQPENALVKPRTHMTPTQVAKYQPEWEKQQKKVDDFALLHDNPGAPDAKNIYHKFPEEKPSNNFLTKKQYSPNYDHKDFKDEKSLNRGNAFLWAIQEMRKKKLADEAAKQGI